MVDPSAAAGEDDCRRRAVADGGDDAWSCLVRVRPRVRDRECESLREIAADLGFGNRLEIRN